MLFRGVIRDHGDFKCLQNIISTLSKNSKECVLNIRPDVLFFIIHQESKRSLPLIYAELKKDACFDEYTFRGVCPENDEIMLVFNPIFLSKALGPVKIFDYVKMKLVKIQENSYLTIDILAISSVSTEKKNIVHNIPVKVILPQKWDLYCLPQVPTFRTIIEMPNIKHIIDKFKNLSPSMTIFVNVSTCSLYLTIETDMTSVIANFFNINVENKYTSSSSRVEVDINSAAPNDDERSCQVGTKSLALFLNSVYYPVEQKCLLIDHESCAKFRFTIKKDVTLYGIATHISE